MLSLQISFLAYSIKCEFEGKWLELRQALHSELDLSVVPALRFVKLIGPLVTRVSSSRAFSLFKALEIGIVWQ